MVLPFITLLIGLIIALGVLLLKSQPHGKYAYLLSVLTSLNTIQVLHDLQILLYDKFWRTTFPLHLRL